MNTCCAITLFRDRSLQARRASSLFTIRRLADESVSREIDVSAQIGVSGALHQTQHHSTFSLSGTADEKDQTRMLRKFGRQCEKVVAISGDGNHPVLVSVREYLGVGRRDQEHLAQDRDSVAPMAQEQRNLFRSVLDPGKTSRGVFAHLLRDQRVDFDAVVLIVG